MNLIFSADRNWGIGKDNDLLFRVKGDMAYFRKMTTGRTVIMGRKTLESLPGGRPLPDRENIVLTRGSLTGEGLAVCHSLEELFDLLGEKHDDEIMVIGGEQIYRQLMPYSRRAYVTRWETEAEADTFVPDLGAQEGWVLLEESSPRTNEEPEGQNAAPQGQTEQGSREGEPPLTYRFCTYINRSPLPWRKEAPAE